MSYLLAWYLCAVASSHGYFYESLTKFQFKLKCLTTEPFLLLSVFIISELKRRMKAEKKAAEKEAKVKEQQDQKEADDQGLQHACVDEETLDPNVRFFYYNSL